MRNDSCGSYTTLMQGIITVFILMFGVNFNAYFFILRRKFDEVFKMSELKGYFGIVAFSIITITINVRHMFPSSRRSSRPQVSPRRTSTSGRSTPEPCWY